MIQLGSFSKIIAPGLRPGRISAAENIINSAINLKQATDLHTSTVDQNLILEFLRQGLFPGHLQRLIDSYSGKMNLMADRLDSQLAASITFDRPEGGMFIWATFDNGIDTHKLFKRAIGQGVAFVPGAAFYRDSRIDYSMRLNFTNSNENEILLGIDRLADLIQTC